MLPFKFNQLYLLIGLSVLTLIMAGGWYVERAGHKAYKNEIKAIAAVQEADNARKKASLDERLNELSDYYQETLSANDLDRQKLQERLKDEIMRNSILNNTVNRLQDDSASRMPKIPINTEECTTAKRDSDRTIDTIVDAGKSCYYDYKYLYDSWQAVCKEYGCE